MFAGPCSEGACGAAGGGAGGSGAAIACGGASAASFATVWGEKPGSPGMPTGAGGSSAVPFVRSASGAAADLGTGNAASPLVLPALCCARRSRSRAREPCTLACRAASPARLCAPPVANAPSEKEIAGRAAASTGGGESAPGALALAGGGGDACLPGCLAACLPG